MLSKLLDIEKEEIGMHSENGSSTKYEKWYWGEYLLNSVPHSWNVVFQAWCAENAGVPFPHVSRVFQVEMYAKSHSQWFDGEYKIGDFAILKNSKVGFVTELDSDGIIAIIGDVDGTVKVETIPFENVFGAYRPDY